MGSPLRVAIAFATVYIVWGSTYYFIQVAVRQIPPMMLGAFRFVTAGVLLAGWCVLTGKGLGDGRQIRIAALSGLMMLLGGTGAVIWAEKWLPSSLVAILISTMPFWFVLLEVSRWKEHLTNRRIIAGLLFGFTGILFMFGENLFTAIQTGGKHHELLGLIILMAGTISWAAGSLYSKHHAGGTVYVSSAWQMLAAGGAFIIGSLLIGEWREFNWHKVGADAWFSVVYLIFLGSLAAYSAYVWLLRVRPAAQVSTYAYVNPVIAVLLGVVFAGESMSVLQVCGLVIILISVMVVNLSNKQASK
jgi:drug/metabolite transporter (DMT)-like permease